MDFQQVADALYAVSMTGGNKAKEDLLRYYDETIEGFTDVLKYIYDPYFKTGLKEAQLRAVGPAGGIFATFTVEQVMDFLKKNNTGSNFAASVANAFAFGNDNPIWQWAAEGLVTKKLSIGVGPTTLNNIFGKGFIPIVGIMRGIQAPPSFQGLYLATEKIDGNRRIIMNKRTGVEVYTRSGKRDYGLVEIEKEVAETLPKGYVFDTECVAVGEFANSIALRQASASILNRRNQTRTGVKALCFDCMLQSEYDAGKSRYAAYIRKLLLAALLGDDDSCEYIHKIATDIDAENQNKTTFAKTVSTVLDRIRSTPFRAPHKHIMALPILGLVRNMDQALDLARPIWDTGGEGIMLVEFMSPYEVAPAPRKTLLKIKQTKEYELKCVDIYEGTGKYEGMLGGIVLDYKGNHVGCGSGFDDYSRALYWEHPELIIGKIVEIDSFGESVNLTGGISLNCPVFKRVKGTKE